MPSLDLFKAKRFLYSPVHAFVSEPRKLFTAALAVYASNIEGNFVETGVSTGGGMSVIMARVAKELAPSKTHFACDSSFESPRNAWRQSFEDYVQNERLDNVRKVGALPPPEIIEKISFLRMEGGSFNHTVTTLHRFYPLVSEGGIVYVDQFEESSRRAFDEYFAGTGDLAMETVYEPGDLPGPAAYFVKTTRRRLDDDESLPPCSPFLPRDMIQDYPLQKVSGPIQADEALTLHSLVRTSSTKRILELGGLHGYSSSVFLNALECKRRVKMYTVDVVPVRSHGPRHKTIQKDAGLLTMDDIDNAPIDLVFMDCHVYTTTKNTVLNLINKNMLSTEAILVLHDTGKHNNKQENVFWLRDGVHQPVERIIAQFLSLHGWNRISLHDDQRPGGGRHGLTIMQRPVDMTVICDDKWKAFFDVPLEECFRIQSAHS